MGTALGLGQLELDGRARLEYLRVCAELKTRANQLVLQQLHTPRMFLKDYALVRRTTFHHLSQLDYALPPRGGFAEALYPEDEALVRALAANRMVREIEISAPICVDQGGVRLLQTIAAVNSAVKLALTLKALSYPAMTVLSDYIGEERCRLVELNLESTHVGDQGVMLLSIALQGNRTSSFFPCANANLAQRGLGHWWQCSTIATQLLEKV